MGVVRHIAGTADARIQKLGINRDRFRFDGWLAGNHPPGAAATFYPDQAGRIQPESRDESRNATGPVGIRHLFERRCNAAGQQLVATIGSTAVESKDRRRLWPANSASRLPGSVCRRL